MSFTCTSRGLALAILLALVAVLVPAGALAQREDSGRSRGQGQRLYDRLDLTENQKAKVNQILSDFQKPGRELIDKVTAARLEIFDVIHADTVDDESIAMAGEALGIAEADLALHKAKLQQEIRTALTLDQIRLQKSMNVQRRIMLEENDGEARRGARQGGR